MHFAEALPEFCKSPTHCQLYSFVAETSGIRFVYCLPNSLKVVYTSVLSHRDICSVMKEIAYCMFFNLSIAPTCVYCKLTLLDFAIKSIMKEFFSLLSLLCIATRTSTVRPSSLLSLLCIAARTSTVRPSSLCYKPVYTKRKEYCEFFEDSGVRRLRCIGLYVFATSFLFVNFC